MKKLTFKKGVLLLSVLYALIIAVGLIVFYGYLARYEAQHPVGAMNTYFADLQKGNTKEIIENSEFPFDAYNTQDVYIQYLNEKYKNGEGNWQYASVDSDDDATTDSYAVYADGKQYGTLHLTRDGNRWRVRSDWAYLPETVYVSAYVPLCNGSPILASCITAPLDVFVGGTDTPPMMMEHTVKTLLPPTITLEQGEAVLSEPDEDGKIWVTVKTEETVNTALKMQASNAARTYACFISGDTKLAEIRALVKSGTAFSKGLSAYDPKWYNEHKSVEFRNFQVADAVTWQENAVTVKVQFDFAVSRGYDEHVYPTTYEIAFCKGKSSFEIVNIAPL